MNKKYFVLGLFVISLLVLGLVIAFNINKDKEVKNKKLYLSGTYYVEIDVEKYGKIKLKLDADKAPITVTNFIDLVNDKFYDGLTFHRIIDGFMIQGGGYDASGNRKETGTIKGEFSSNNVVNDISHKRGVISMARNPYDNDSASSEFFITQADDEYLDGDYAAFGEVIEGMDVVDKIAKKAKPIDSNGSIDISDRPVIKTIRVVGE